MEIRIDEGQLSRAIAAAHAALPHEACGLLLGRVLDDGAVEVVSVDPARNATDEPAEDRYEVHPEDFVALDARARAAGLDVVGVWHSHPDSGPVPSATDTARAHAGWSYLIVGPARQAQPQARSWRLDAHGRFREERLVLCGRDLLAPAPRRAGARSQAPTGASPGPASRPATDTEAARTTVHVTR